jgi:nicotinamide riboside kinase
MAGILKVVLTGPESSGKSELARHLSQHFSITFVPEFARIYLEREGPDYNFELVSKLARLHWEFQQEHIGKAKEVIILDTDLINYEIWQKMEFGKVDPWITDQIEEESDHRYLITYPDLPWVEDPLRANKFDREILFNLHRRAVLSRNRRLESIRGQGALQLSNAEKHFRRILSHVDD